MSPSDHFGSSSEDKTMADGGQQKSQDAYRTISEAAELLDLPQHVLRFWEGKFPQIKPLKRGGNRRYYRPADVETLFAIKQLLHEDGYTIRGVQKLFKEQGLRATVAQALGLGDGEGLVEEGAPQEARADEDVAVPVTSDPLDVATFLTSQPTDNGRLKGVLTELKALRALLND